MSKKEKKEKQVNDFSEFVKVTLKDMVMNKLHMIKDICEKYQGLESIEPNDWIHLANFVAEVSRAAIKSGETSSSIYRTEISKRGSFGLINKVRESERKKFIINFINKLSDDEDNNAYVCYMIFSHLSIMLSENSK